MKKYTYLILIALFAVGGITLMGCNKKKDTIAKIYIRNESNTLVAGARVVLLGKSTTGQQGKVNVGDTTLSNAAGEAIFNLNDMYQKGQAGVAVLDISASLGVATGKGIIKIVEEETSEETVFIQ